MSIPLEELDELLHEICGGDPDAACELIIDLQAHVNTLYHTMLEDGTPTAMAKGLHQLSGASALMGLRSLAWLLAEEEQRARRAPAVSHPPRWRQQADRIIETYLTLLASPPRGDE